MLRKVYCYNCYSRLPCAAGIATALEFVCSPAGHVKHVSALSESCSVACRPVLLDRQDDASQLTMRQMCENKHVQALAV